LAALHYGHPLTTWFVGKFYTHTPLFKPPRYGPAPTPILIHPSLGLGPIRRCSFAVLFKTPARP
jgi:hypothetical protein